VVGTRPDAIKSAPIILELRNHSDIETVVVATGQHREMLRQALGAFGLQPDIDLDIMQHGQSLADVTTRSLEGLDKAFADLQPNYVMAQGDTTTTFVAALTSFYRGIPFGHIEAGLRTSTIRDPFPEEFNRRAAGLVAEHHFAPTKWAADNLLREGKNPKSIFVTGNTGIDAVRKVSEKDPTPWNAYCIGRLILLTTHRRENWGEPQKRIALAARKLVCDFHDTWLVIAMHPNPKVRETLFSVFGSNGRWQLIEPPDYSEFVKLMRQATLILTDSGGVQEEAPAFAKPVLVLRETTERPEGIEAGTAKLVGTDEKRIYEEGARLLKDEQAYTKMAKAASPYGDGRAAERIASVVLRFLGANAEQVEMWH